MNSRSRLLAAMSAAALAAAAPAVAMAHTVPVELFAINDLHGRLEPPGGQDGLVAGTPAGGIAYLAAHLRAARRTQPNSLIVGAGDMMGGSPFLSARFDEMPTIAALNALHLAVTSIGNHELDDGRAGFERRIAGHCRLRRACVRPSYRYLAANVRAGSADVLPASAIYRVGGVRIGFIGAAAENMPTVLAPGAAKGLTFLDPAARANAAARALEAQGVHAIVLLIHAGGGQTPAAGSVADPSGCAGFDGEILPVLARLSPAIKIVISAHTHQAYVCRIDGRLVTSAAAFGRMFTRISIEVDAATDDIVAAAARNEIVTRDLAPDAAQVRLLAHYLPEAARVTERIVGSAAAAIPRTENAAGESPLGDLIADAMLTCGAPTPDARPVDLAFVNSGGIRSDLTPDGDGKIRFGTVYAVQPFGNRLTAVTMTGDAILRLLEQQFAGRSPSILQVSKGLTYSYRHDATAGQHVDAASIRLDGRPIAPGARLRVCVSDFLLAGGDGFTVFREATDRVAGRTDLDALLAYIARQSPVQVPRQDRIVRTDPPAGAVR